MNAYIALSDFLVLRSTAAEAIVFDSNVLNISETSNAG